MKKLGKSRLLLVLISVIIAFGACAKSNENAMYDLNSKNMENQSKDSPYESGYAQADEDIALSNTALPPAERKIITNASLDMEALDAVGLYKQIVDYGGGLGGYEFSYNITNHDEYSIINAVFKIPPEQMSAFMNFIGENGKIINSSMNSEDITENYYDMQSRLDTKRKSLDRYYDLLEKADTIEEIIQLQRTIDGIIMEIESYEGKLKVWNSLVDMATVNLYIRQYNDPVKIKKDISWNTLTFDDMGYLIKRGFVSIVNTIVSLLQWIFIALAAYSPLWITILCIFLVVKKRIKKHRGNIEEKNNKDFEDR